MLWSICLTSSYCEGLNLLNTNSSKFLFELLKYVLKGNNIILSDDQNSSSIEAIAKKIDDNVCPEYAIELTELIIEIKKWINIEQDPSSQKKLFLIPLQNNEEDEFLEEIIQELYNSKKK